MKLTSPSSVLVTWDDQVAESFFLNIYLDTTGVNLWKRYIPGNNYTFTGLPSASCTAPSYMFCLIEGSVTIPVIFIFMSTAQQIVSFIIITLILTSFII